MIKWSNMQNRVIKFTLVVNLIKRLGVNLLTLFCKLDLFLAMHQILLMFIKWSSLQKSVSTIMPK